jgi:hypothetical protein
MCWRGRIGLLDSEPEAVSSEQSPARLREKFHEKECHLSYTLRHDSLRLASPRKRNSQRGWRGLVSSRWASGRRGARRAFQLQLGARLWVQAALDKSSLRRGADFAYIGNLTAPGMY